MLILHQDVSCFFPIKLDSFRMMKIKVLLQKRSSFLNQSVYKSYLESFDDQNDGARFSSVGVSDVNVSSTKNVSNNLKPSIPNFNNHNFLTTFSKR